MDVWGIVWEKSRELDSQGCVTRVEGSNPGHGEEVFLGFQERERSRFRNYVIIDLNRGEKIKKKFNVIWRAPRVIWCWPHLTKKSSI